jgi:peptide/nickel transport system substrate-binding protein
MTTAKQLRSIPCSFSFYKFILCTALLLAASGCRRGGTAGELVMMLEKRVETFDPRVSADSAAERLRQLIFNALTRKNEKFEPVGDLAESFTNSPDYKTFTFRLRPNVKFHDGRVLSAADVKYTFDTMLAKGFRSAKKIELEGALESVALDPANPLSIVFNCKMSFPGLPNALVPVGIIPEGSTDTQPKQPIGTGPFRFVSHTEDQEILLAAYKDFFAGAPNIESLRIKIIPDNSTRESELRKGSVDLAINADFDPVTIEGLQKAENIKVDLAEGTNLTHLGVNLLDPILKDQRVRQALAYAIDREQTIRDVLRSQARPAHSILPPSQELYEPNVTQYNYDPNRAKQLLDEAGRPEKDGQPRLKLTLKTSTISLARKTGEALQEQLRRIGVQVELQSLEQQKLTQDMIDGNFQLYLRTMVGGNQSPDIFRFVYGSKSVPPNGQNRSRYSNPQVDGLFEEAQTATSERRKQIFSEAQKILSNELPQIYLWYPATVVIYRDRVTNVKADPSGDFSLVRQVKLAN